MKANNDKTADKLMVSFDHLLRAIILNDLKTVETAKNKPFDSLKDRKLNAA